MANEATSRPLFFIHGVGFGLVSFPSHANGCLRDVQGFGLVSFPSHANGCLRDVKGFGLVNFPNDANGYLRDVKGFGLLSFPCHANGCLRDLKDVLTVTSLAICLGSLQCFRGVVHTAGFALTSLEVHGCGRSFHTLASSGR
jgi:hypothetical protein